LLIQQWQVFDDPAIECGMVNLDAALFHHFFELPIADRIRQIPTDAPQDHVTFKMAALEFNHRIVPLEPFSAIIPQTSTALGAASSVTRGNRDGTYCGRN
jgi:hypothetical protein